MTYFGAMDGYINFIFTIEINYLLSIPFFNALTSGLQKDKLFISFNDLFITLIVGSRYPNDTCLSPCSISKA